MLFIGFVLSTCIAQNMTRDQIEEYLRTFAYLGDENPDPQMGELQSHPDLQFALAIRTFQRFAGLNETGVVDDDTVRMMRMPRCGVKDTLTMGGIARRRKRYAASSGDKWNKLHLTYRFRGYTPDLPRDTVRRVFVKAFEMWSQVSALTFSETSAVPDIWILFAAGSHGDRNPFDGPGSTLAHAYFPGSGIGGDAHFDEDEQWTDNTYSGTNLLQVAVHEIGHSLGLGHSDVQSAIMAPFYRGYKPNFSLDQDDIDGIRYLYGQGGPDGRPTSIGPLPSTTPAFGTPPPPPPSGYCPLEGFCQDFDAIDVIDSTIYAFKGAFYARLSPRGAIVDVRRIQETWPDLPTSLDAVMSTNRYVYFFKGSQYWRMANRAAGGNRLTRKLIRVGFPGVPYNVDAAFVWSGNGRIYFIKGGQYWRYRGGYGVDRGYPLTLNYWRNVRRPVNDVFRYYGVTYFFSGPGYQVFNDRRFAAGQPRSTKDLMECCTRDQELLAQYINADSTTEADSATESTNSSPTPLKFASRSQLGLLLVLVSVLSALL